jgi:hypothetical protein
MNAKKTIDMNHRIGRIVFSLGIGLIVAIFAYRWIVDPAPRAERELQESVVATSRDLLVEKLAIGDIEIVDAIAPDRKIGKTYVYRANQGWELSGFYRRNENDLWHPYLMLLDNSAALIHLKVSDGALLDRASDDAALEVLP